MFQLLEYQLLKYIVPYFGTFNLEIFKIEYLCNLLICYNLRHFLKIFIQNIRIYQKCAIPLQSHSGDTPMAAVH